MPAACPACTCPRLVNYGNVFTWEQLKMQRSLQRDRVGLDWLYLLCFSLLMRCLTYLSLRGLRRYSFKKA